MSNRPDATLLADAARHATRAPSVHNTQPWRFVAGPESLELHIEPARRLHAIDPHGRLLIISCGAVLHHVTAILAARGWIAHIERLPDPDQPNLLARVTLGERTEVTAAATRIVHAMAARFTDRRPVSDTPVPDGMLELLQATSAEAGATLHPLAPEQISSLARAAMKANEIGINNPDQRDELYYWIGGLRTEGTGVPDSALPDHPLWTQVPGRDFTRLGTLQTGEGTASAATHTILYRDGDERVDWLLSGEALSACWLKATDLGLAVLPLSTVIEIASTRETLRRMLPDAAYPLMVLRFGVPDPQLPPPPLTPRLSPDEFVVSADEQ